MNLNAGILGRKIGMTQIYDASGKSWPVTAIDAGPCRVIQVKTPETDGYSAIQIGMDDKPARNAPDEIVKKAQGARGRYEVLHGRTRKPQRGHFFKAGESAPMRFLREIRLEDVSAYEPGQEIKVDEVFELGQFVDVVGTSKGRGFTGVIKRHGFKLFLATHGTHEWRRHGGSIGCCKPMRVIKGKRMPGQHGNKRVTVQNLRIEGVLEGQNVLLVRGGVPGPNGGYLIVRKAIKK
ncbi:MAG: 50S ribosomal protein L3 [Planctomycetota bacterium]|jgi:large subunit ribosomal protein L3